MTVVTDDNRLDMMEFINGMTTCQATCLGAAVKAGIEVRFWFFCPWTYSFNNPFYIIVDNVGVCSQWGRDDFLHRRRAVLQVCRRQHHHGSRGCGDGPGEWYQDHYHSNWVNTSVSIWKLKRSWKCLGFYTVFFVCPANTRPDADQDIESLADLSNGKTYFIPDGNYVIPVFLKIGVNSTENKIQT